VYFSDWLIVKFGGQISHIFLVVRLLFYYFLYHTDACGCDRSAKFQRLKSRMNGVSQLKEPVLNGLKKSSQ